MNEKVFKNYKDFPFEELSNCPAVKCKKGQRKKGNTYIDAIAAFDIETTKIPHHELAVMFIWQFHISFLDNEYTVLGRTWEEFKAFMDLLACAIPEEHSLMIFDHNFNYEFGYLKSVIKFTDKEGYTKIFSINKHKPICAHSHHGTFIWRDSLILFNTNLDEVTKDCAHHKLGDFDYTKKRFYWTPLTDEEYQYCINDVYGLVEAVKDIMRLHGDNQYSLPFTGTGYIRRDIKRMMYTHTRFNDYPADTYNIYKLLRKSFRGGNTHANRFYAGDIYTTVSSWDRSSSYPDVMVNDRFPISPLMPDANCTLQHLAELTKNDYAYLVDMKLTNVRLKNEVEPLPYQSVSKTYGRIGLGREDNGRLMEIQQCHIAFTDIDWEIFSKQYDFDEAQIICLYTSHYGYLPFEIRDYVKGLYKDKTTLKGVKGKEDAYRISKTKINGVYGLTVQKVENEDIFFNEETLMLEEMDFEQSEYEDEIDYMNISRRRPMPYRWGVWVTAHARAHLQKIIDAVGADFLYADTDSCKFLNADLHKEAIEEINNFYIERSKQSGAFATDPKGKTHYMGAYEYEGTYDEFITMGSKKYAVVEDGETEITIAGVPKEAGSKELVEMGGLDAFKPGTIFHAGKLRPVYNDKDDYGDFEVYDCYGTTGTVHCSSNVCLVDVEYKLGYSEEYLDLLTDIKAMKEIPSIMSSYEYYMDKYNFN